MCPATPCALVSLKLHVLDGFAVREAAAKLNGAIPVIFLSAQTNQCITNAAGQIGDIPSPPKASIGGPRSARIDTGFPLPSAGMTSLGSSCSYLQARAPAFEGLSSSTRSSR